MTRAAPLAISITFALIAMAWMCCRPGNRAPQTKLPVATQASIRIGSLRLDSIPTPEMAASCGGEGPSATSHRRVDGEPHFLVGATAEQRGAYELIEDAWAIVIKDQSGSVREAQAILDEHQEKACSLLLDALRLAPDDEIVTRQAHRADMRYGTYRELARLQMDLGRPDDALGTYATLLARLPSPDSGIWVDIAAAWEAKGDQPRALAYFWTAAERGYGRHDVDPRGFLYDAIRRLTPDEAQRVEQLQSEVEKFGDWIAHYHLARYFNPGGTDECLPRVRASRLESMVAALEGARAALDRSEAASGHRDQDLHDRLDRECLDARFRLARRIGPPPRRAAPSIAPRRSSLIGRQDAGTPPSPGRESHVARLAGVTAVVILGLFVVACMRARHLARNEPPSRPCVTATRWKGSRGMERHSANRGVRCQTMSVGRSFSLSTTGRRSIISA